MTMYKAILLGAGIFLLLIVSAGTLLLIQGKELENLDGVNSMPLTSGEDPLPGSLVHDLPIPDAVANARLDLAERLSVEARKIVILEAKDVVWPNSCIGSEKEGQMCLQVLTPGYTILMEAHGKEYRYHTNKSGTVVLFVEEKR